MFNEQYVVPDTELKYDCTLGATCFAKAFRIMTLWDGIHPDM
jgi:hypothetical protein